MLNLAEFIALGNELQVLGWAADNNIQKHVKPDTSKKDAMAYAQQVADQWDEDYDILLSQGVINVIANSVDHYNNSLNLGLEASTIVSDVQAAVMTKQFYGATVARRKLMNAIRIKRVIAQTAQIDPLKLGGLFSETVPFGAQTNIARRLLLGTVVHAEHETAKAVADKADVPFLRWVLSHKHQQEDACDELAGYVDDKVVAYLNEHNLDLDPTGLYFAGEVPDPPHPNCQCELAMVTTDGEEVLETSNHLERAFHAIRKLLQRIKQK